MKKLFIALMLLMSMTIQAQIPNTFKIKECVISIGTDFTIDEINADIVEEVISLTTIYHMLIDNEKYAKARQKIVSIGTVIEIFDKNDKLIGSVEEKLFTSFGFYSLYNIYDANGKKIAYSEKHKYMTTKFKIKSANMQKSDICTISRPMVNVFSDTWTVDFNDSNFDKRLLVFIPCFKTYYDNKN